MAERRSQRVAILSPLFSNSGAAHGGITPVILNLARALIARGVEIDLLVRLPPKHRQSSASLPAGAHMIDLASRHRLGTAIGTIRYLRQAMPAALLSAGHHYNLAAAWARQFVCGTRVVLSVHNTVSVAAGSLGRFSRWQRIRSVGFWYPRADEIVAVSMGVADDLVKQIGIGENRIEVIQNPIVTPATADRAAEHIEHPWFAPGAPPVILGAGRLVAQKAFHHLIDAFARVRARRECRLMILGEGSFRAGLEAQIRSLNLEQEAALPGFVSNPLAYMSRAAVFALSSDFEGFGNVLVEAMAAGTPVVATDCPHGPGEILGGGRFGKLVPPGNADALASAIFETLERSPAPGLLQEAVRPFEADRVAAKYLEVFGIS